MSIYRVLASSCAASALLAMVFVLPVAAQEEVPPKEDKVIAIVNGHEIRVSEVQSVAHSLTSTSRLRPAAPPPSYLKMYFRASRSPPATRTTERTAASRRAL